MAQNPATGGERAGALPARRYGDPRRAEELLGFRAETRLADGMRALITWRSEALAATRR